MSETHRSRPFVTNGGWLLPPRRRRSTRHFIAQLHYETIAFGGYRAHFSLGVSDPLGVAPRASPFIVRLSTTKLYRQQFKVFSCANLHDGLRFTQYVDGGTIVVNEKLS
jgi:hypothetical protein